jgi:hypothetical protein
MAIELIALAAGAAFLFALLMAAIAKESREQYLGRVMGDVRQLVGGDKLTEARGKFETAVAKEYLHRGGASGRIPESFTKEMGNYAVQTGLFEAMMKRSAIPQGVSPETYIMEAVHNVVKNPLLKMVSANRWEDAWTSSLTAGDNEKALLKVAKHYVGVQKAKEISDKYTGDMRAYMRGRWAPHERTETPRQRQERLKQEAHMGKNT